MAIYAVVIPRDDWAGLAFDKCARMGLGPGIIRDHAKSCIYWVKGREANSNQLYRITGTEMDLGCGRPITSDPGVCVDARGGTGLATSAFVTAGGAVPENPAGPRGDCSQIPSHMRFDPARGVGMGSIADATWSCVLGLTQDFLWNDLAVGGVRQVYEMRPPILIFAPWIKAASMSDHVDALGTLVGSLDHSGSVTDKLAAVRTNLPSIITEISPRVESLIPRLSLADMEAMLSAIQSQYGLWSCLSPEAQTRFACRAIGAIATTVQGVAELSALARSARLQTVIKGALPEAALASGLPESQAVRLGTLGFRNNPSRLPQVSGALAKGDLQEALWLASQAGDQVEVTGLLSDLERMINGGVKVKGVSRFPNEGRNVFIIEYENGIKGVFKGTEPLYEPLPLISENYSYSYVYEMKHEIFAYQLDQILGLNVVPATIETNIRGIRGSLQLYIPGKLHLVQEGMTPRDIRFLDYLQSNFDRGGNHLIAEGSHRIVAIDNGSSFELPLPSIDHVPDLSTSRDVLSLTPTKASYLKLRDTPENVFADLVGRMIGKEFVDGFLQRRRDVLAAIKREHDLQGDRIFIQKP